jgi:uncharacterized protein (DUF362 family)
MQIGKSSVAGSSSRRDFIRKSAIGIMGISIFARTFPLFVNASNKVVVVRHKNVFGPDGHARQKLVVDMVNRGIIELTGAGNLTDAWYPFFRPGDVIGLKINAISFRGLTNTPLASHYPALTNAIISSCARAGMDGKQFVIWDRSDSELVNLGYTPSNDPGGLRVFGTYKHHHGSDGIGFHPELHPVGKKSSRVSRILSDICTAMINVPVIKPHMLAGITAALKNHYGTIDNPSSFHLGACTDPGIPEINAIPVIRSKERLVICNALQVLYKGGVSWKPANAWPYGGIILGTDPVAVDSVCLKIINEKRRQSNKSIIDNRARHIPMSEQLGIGVADLDKIGLVEIDLV